jgi:hypothetical protein
MVVLKKLDNSPVLSCQTPLLGAELHPEPISQDIDLFPEETNLQSSFDPA